MTTSSLFPTSATPTTITVNDGNSINVGVQFYSTVPGSVTGVRFYKGPQNLGTHVGALWDASTQALLARVTFTGETATGWQEALFDAPVSIEANKIYAVSYLAPDGFYSSTANFFGEPWVAAPLVAPAAGPIAANGVYQYGSALAFPTATFNATNYWVDLTFESGNAMATYSNDQGQPAGAIPVWTTGGHPATIYPGLVNANTYSYTPTVALELVFAHVVYNASATVGNRVVSLQLLDGSGNAVGTWETTPPITASQTGYHVEFAGGVYREATFDANHTVQTPFPVGLTVPAGYTLKVLDLANVSAADTMTIGLQLR